MRILALGDIVGRPGREAVRQLLPQLIREEKIDLVVANAENAAAGSGLTPEIFRDILMRLDRGEYVEPGVFNDARHTSDPEGENTSLTDPALYDGSAAKTIDRLPNAEPAPAE